jgi:hypothetical protein
LFCCTTTKAQSILSWKTEPVNGKVKTIEIVGFDLPSPDYDSYKIKNRSALHFDTAGNLLYKQIFNDFGAPYSSNQIIYAANGRIIETKTSNIASTKTKNIKFTYNELGNLIESQNYENDEPVHPTIAYTSNAFNQIIVEKFSYPSGELSFTDSFSYDNKGRQIVRKSINSNGTEMIYKSYYNDQGYLTVLDRFNKGGNLESRCRYNYENPDKMGNWQKKTGYKNDKLFTETTRKFTYYK